MGWQQRIYPGVYVEITIKRKAQHHNDDAGLESEYLKGLLRLPVRKAGALPAFVLLVYINEINCQKMGCQQILRQPGNNPRVPHGSL